MSLMFDEAGSGLPLILLHAFPLDRQMWQPQLHALSAHARVVALDLPGFGDSSNVSPFTSIEGAADAVAERLDSMGLSGRVAMLGLSMGGYVAMAFARRYSDRLSALILADTRADADSDSSREGRDAMIALMAKASVEAVVEQMLPRLLCEETRNKKPDLVEIVRRMGNRQCAPTMRDALIALRDRPDSLSLLKQLTIPSLILVGEQDSATPPELAEAMHVAIRGSTLCTIPHAGHLSNLENPDPFNEAVAEFLLAHSND